MQIDLQAENYKRCENNNISQAIPNANVRFCLNLCEMNDEGIQQKWLQKAVFLSSLHIFCRKVAIL